MNKQRERLKELLEKHCAVAECKAHSQDCTAADCASCLADHILADGWMRPPCNVGDVVYRIVEMSTGVTKVFKRALCPPYTCETIINCKPTIKRFIRSVVVTKNNFFDVCENYGKTVFLTKEEAEEALKGGVQG